MLIDQESIVLHRSQLSAGRLCKATRCRGLVLPSDVDLSTPAITRSVHNHGPFVLTDMLVDFESLMKHVCVCVTYIYTQYEMFTKMKSGLLLLA